MTANQINYAKLQEETRHNYEIEKYNERMAHVQERQAAVAEQNAATNWQSVLVSANQVGVNSYVASENARHNLILEQQQEQHLVNEAGQTSANWWGKIWGTVSDIGRTLIALA